MQVKAAAAAAALAAVIPCFIHYQLLPDFLYWHYSPAMFYSDGFEEGLAIISKVPLPASFLAMIFLTRVRLAAPHD